MTTKKKRRTQMVHATGPAAILSKIDTCVLALENDICDNLDDRYAVIDVLMEVRNEVDMLILKVE